jgi:thiamine transport system permease protein
VTGRRLHGLALPVALAATLAVLVVVFYYPVGSVLATALRGDGGPSLGPLLSVLGDPFYTGAAHHLVTDPLGVPGGVVEWLRAGPAVPSFGLVGFTVYQAGLSTVASVCLGLPGAYLLSRYEFRGRATLRSLTVLPFVLPAIMVAVGFIAMFGRTGVLNGLLAFVGLGPVDVLFTLELVVLAHAFYNAPLVVRLVTAAWESVDARRVETARAMGASPARAFRDVVLPQVRPALLTAALLTFIFTFMSFPIVLALGGLQLATLEVWLYSRVQNLALAEAATLGAIETALSLALTYGYLRYEARATATRTGGPALGRRPLLAGRRTLRDPRRVALLGYCLLALVVFAGPLASLLIESVTGPNGRFTAAYYGFLLERQASTVPGTTRPLPAVRNSLVFAAGTLLIAVPMGLVVSLVATRGGRGSRLAEAGLTAPLAVSGVVVGLGLLQTLVFGTVLFGRRYTVTGPVAILLAHAVAAYPFVSRNVTPALERIDEDVVAAARSLGATRLRTLVDVKLPLVAPAVVAGGAFTVAISVGEFDSTVLLANGVDAATMPVALERYVGNRSLGPSLGPATAMGSVLLFVTAASFVVVDRVGGRWRP